MPFSTLLQGCKPQQEVGAVYPQPSQWWYERNNFNICPTYFGRSKHLH